MAFALSYIKLSRPYSLFWFITPYITYFYSISTILFLCFYVFLLYVFILFVFLFPFFYFLRVVGLRDLVFLFLVYFWLKVAGGHRPLWSSGYDLSLSRRKRGFKSLWGCNNTQDYRSRSGIFYQVIPVCQVLLLVYLEGLHILYHLIFLFICQVCLGDERKLIMERLK